MNAGMEPLYVLELSSSTVEAEASLFPDGTLTTALYDARRPDHDMRLSSTECVTVHDVVDALDLLESQVKQVSLDIPT